MSASPVEFVRHIRDETDYLARQSRNLSKKDFLQDETLKRAFVRSIEIIGEATKRLPEDFKEKHADVEWRQIAGMRDRLIHGYFSIDYDIVWDVITNKVPALQHELEKILEMEAEG